MSICGYNEMIGQGIRLMVKGMAVELIKKSDETTPKLALERELEELPVLINKMKEKGNSTEIEMFVGLNLLAKALFIFVNDGLSKNSESADLDSLCALGADNFISILEETEKESLTLRREPKIYNKPAVFADYLADFALRCANKVATDASK